MVIVNDFAQAIGQGGNGTTVMVPLTVEGVQGLPPIGLVQREPTNTSRTLNGTEPNGTAPVAGNTVLPDACPVGPDNVPGSKKGAPLMNVSIVNAEPLAPRLHRS